MKKPKPIYKSDCCNTIFDTKSNGLYSYYVCHNCHNKTNPKKLDMRKKENKPTTKKGSGKMLSRALSNSTPSKSIKKKLSPVLPTRKLSGKSVKEMNKKELNERIVANSKKKPRATRKVVDEFPDLESEPYKIQGEDYFTSDKPLIEGKLKSNTSWWEYMKAKKMKDGEFTIKVLGETVTILPNITILRIGHDSKQLSGNNKFLLLEKKVQEFMVTLTKELLNNMDKGESRYFLADKKAFEFAIAKYPKVPKMFWFFAFITLISENYSELNSKRTKRLLNKFFSSKTK
jgi:hypothetical protein